MQIFLLSNSLYCFLLSNTRKSDNKPFEVVKLLLQSGASTDNIILISYITKYAILNNDKALIDLVIEKGMDVSPVDQEGKNALHWAIENNMLEISNKLAAYNPDLLKVSDSCQKAALLLAQELNFQACVENLTKLTETLD